MYTLEYYSAIKKKEWNLSICEKVDGPKGYYGQVKSAKKEKDK